MNQLNDQKMLSPPQLHFTQKSFWLACGVDGGHFICESVVQKSKEKRSGDDQTDKKYHDDRRDDTIDVHNYQLNSPNKAILKSVPHFKRVNFVKKR